MKHTDKKELINQLNTIIETHNLNLKIMDESIYVILVFPKTNDFKVQWYIIETKEYSMKKFIECLEDYINLENLDDTAIFMYKRLRKTPITLREVIDEAENRRKILLNFIEILSKNN